MLQVYKSELHKDLRRTEKESGRIQSAGFVPSFSVFMVHKRPSFMKAGVS